MKQALVTFMQALWLQTKDTVGDKNAWLLAGPAMGLLAYLDDAKLLTLLEWMVYAAVIAGFSIQISRTMFPQIKLTAMVEKAMEDSRAAGAVAAALVVFVGLLFLSLAFWTKP